MGKNIGSVLKVGAKLSTNDIMRSPQGYYFATLQEDGNFVVYRGPEKSKEGFLWATRKTASGGEFIAILQTDGNFVVYQGSKPSQSGLVWNSGKTAPGGQFIARMQDDGNLVVYKGENPAAGKVLWQSGKTDPVVSVDDLTEIDYDCQNAKILSEQPQQIPRLTAKNETATPQEMDLSGSVEVSQQAGWEDVESTQITVTGTITGGVPGVLSGQVSVGVGETFTFKQNGSTARTSTLAWKAKVTVPAKTTYYAYVTVMESKINVPYKIKGTLHFEEGATLHRGTVTGMFAGTNSHDVTIDVRKGEKVVKTLHPEAVARASARE